MADSDSGTSGIDRTAKKVGKVGRKGRGKKVHSKSVSKDDELMCQVCSVVFKNPADKLMECERCENWFCTTCLKMSDDVYKVMVDHKDLHWFCSECEKPAISAVRSDKEIEEKCAAYMSSMTDKISKIEEKLDSKADKCTVEELGARITRLEGKGAEKQNDTQSDTVRITIEEQREREFRKRNIIIQSLPESKESETEKRMKEDIQSVEKVLSAIGIVDDSLIEKCVRLGRKEAGKTRMTKVTVNSEDTKKKILRKSKALQSNDDLKQVYIGPDLTRMQRTEQFNLRKELRERKEKGETDIFISRGRIVQARERALQFKGGASSSEAEK